MAGTGKVPKKPEAPAAGAAGPEKKPEAKAAEAAKEPEEEKIPPLGWAMLAGSIVLMLVGGLMFMMQFFWAGDRTAWLVVGAVLGIGGVVALSYFFDKFGKL